MVEGMMIDDDRVETRIEGNGKDGAKGRPCRPLISRYRNAPTPHPIVMGGLPVNY